MVCHKQTSTAQRIHPHLTPSENGGRDEPNWQPQHSALTLISEWNLVWNEFSKHRSHTPHNEWSYWSCFQSRSAAMITTIELVRIHPSLNIGTPMSRLLILEAIEIAARALVSSPNVPLRPSIVLSGTGVPQMSVHDSISLGWTSMMSPWWLWSWTTDKRSEYWGSGRLWCDGRLWTGRGRLVGGQPCAWPSGCDCACRLVEARGADPAWCGRNQEFEYTARSVFV